MKQIIALLIIVSAFLFFSCKDKGTEPPVSSNDYKVLVKDTLGNPISGVNAYLIYENGYIYGKSKPLTDTMIVDLSSFTASVVGKTIQLDWETTRELNLRYFEIQSRCFDTLSSWITIDIVSSTGNSDSLKHYSYIDDNIGAGWDVWYRLRMVDFSGHFIYFSNVVKTGIPILYTNSLNQCFPNPFNGSATTIDYIVKENSKVSIKIIAYNKSIIKRTLINDFADSSSHQPAGHHEFHFNDVQPYLGSGLYTVQYIVQSMITGKIDTMENTLFKHEPDLGSLPNTEPCTVSGTDGKFTIPYDKFYINAEYDITGCDAPDIIGRGRLTNTPTLVLIKDGYQTFSQKITVNSSSNPEETFVLSKTK